MQKKINRARTEPGHSITGTGRRGIIRATRKIPGGTGTGI